MALRSICSVLLVLLSTASFVRPEKTSLPEPKHLTLEQIGQGLPTLRLEVETFTLTCLYNRLQIKKDFDWYCKHFGEGPVRKLRSFIKLTEDKVSPTFIQIDLKTKILYYRPVGAVGSDLTQSGDWAGRDLEDVANALSYAKAHLVAIAQARDRYYANAATWAETLAFCRDLDRSGFTTPEEKWAIRGLLFSPKSEPQTQLALVAKDDPGLANYGKAVKAQCSLSRTITGRILDFPNQTEMIVDSGSGLRTSYHAFETAIDVDRKPVDAKALLAVADKSNIGVLADVRYVEQGEQRIVLTCQLRGLTTSLIDQMADQPWDGSYTMALQILQNVEEETGRSAVTEPQKRVKQSVKGATTPDAKARKWLRKSLGVRW